jgi:thiol-disulfide isomerase/thioredoxin
MPEQAVRARASEMWVWFLVAVATASVVALAVIHSSRVRRQSVPPQRAPAVTLPLLGGGKASLPRGKVTMVDFWATWCAPCKVSMPRVQKLWTEYRPRGAELYSVDTDDPSPDREKEVRAFLAENGLRFPVVVDDGTASEAFSVVALPTLLLVDQTGQVVWTHVGALTPSRERDLRGALERALSP